MHRIPDIYGLKYPSPYSLHPPTSSRPPNTPKRALPHPLPSIQPHPQHYLTSPQTCPLTYLLYSLRLPYPLSNPPPSPPRSAPVLPLPLPRGPPPSYLYLSPAIRPLPTSTSPPRSAPFLPQPLTRPTCPPGPSLLLLQDL